MRVSIFIILTFFISNTQFGQVTFTSEYIKANPLEENSTLNADEKTAFYEKNLEEALKSEDRTKSFFGYLYLLSDKMRHQDYVLANSILLKADSIAVLANNKSWMGHILQRKAILAMRLDENDNALKWYAKAAAVCSEAKDSLCMAEAYEQLSYLYGIKGELSLSESYYKKSIPLFKRHGSEKSLATAYNNFATINTIQGNTEVAIALYKSALVIFEKLKLASEVSRVMNNLADAYRNIKEYQKAKDILEKCISINKKESFLTSLFVNYENLSAVLDSMRDYKASLRYLVLHHKLKDSLISQETITKIADLNKRYEVQEKENQIIENELALKKAEVKDNIKTMVILFIIILAGLIFGIFYKKILSVAAKLKKSKQMIFSLSKNNVEKSSKINQLEQDILKFKSIIHQNQDDSNKPEYENLYKTILTYEDWMAFKTYFADKHPRYIDQLRESHPTLTEAEERLFLLTKLYLSTKEIASILGIESDSVKKTRSRLKKKLLISDDVTLDDYIFQFNT